MHGTPGGRRQIPVAARGYAISADLRLIGVDRPGIGASTPHLYRNVGDWVDDLRMLLDTLGIDRAHVIGSRRLQPGRRGAPVRRRQHGATGLEPCGALRRHEDLPDRVDQDLVAGNDHEQQN
jgi:hypothetical protein